MEGLSSDHSSTADAQQHWDTAKLSNAKVEEGDLSASLVYWRDPESPQQLMRFGDMADFGVPQVGLHAMHAHTLSGLMSLRRLVGKRLQGLHCAFMPNMNVMTLHIPYGILLVNACSIRCVVPSLCPTHSSCQKNCCAVYSGAVAS